MSTKGRTNIAIFSLFGLGALIAGALATSDAEGGISQTELDSMGRQGSSEVYGTGSNSSLNKIELTNEQLNSLRPHFPNAVGLDCRTIDPVAGIPAAYTAVKLAGNPNDLENPVARITPNGELQVGTVYQIGRKTPEGKRVVYRGDLICVGVGAGKER